MKAIIKNNKKILSTFHTFISRQLQKKTVNFHTLLQKKKILIITAIGPNKRQC